jgi:hypothetical protein
MALEDALDLIVAEWPSIEPTLTVRELKQIASAAAHRRLSLRIFQVIAPALAADHPAWTRLASSRTRLQVGAARSADRSANLLVKRARAALAAPTIDLDAAADDLAEETLNWIAGFGIVDTPPDFDDDRLRPLVLAVHGRLVCPTFQFRPTEPFDVYPLVAELHEPLAADVDPVGAVAWWLTDNAWLAARPADLLGSGREREVKYAADQLHNDSW